MTVVAALRLDEDLWTPSALGVVGPGRLRAAAAGVEELYRPLLTVHRDRPGVGLDDGPGRVDLVSGDEAWDALAAEPLAGPVATGPLGWLRGHPSAVLVSVRPPGGPVKGLLAARPDPLVPSVGEVVLVWLPELDAAVHRDLLGRAWLRLAQAAAYRGLVGLYVGVGHRGARDVAMLRDLAGFRPVAEHYGAVGLAPSDAATVLDQWRVTVADDEVTDIGLLAGADEGSQMEMLRRVAPLVTRRGPDPAAVEGAYRLSFGGPVTLDGCAGYGPVGEGDWWEPDPDLQPDVARPRAEWVLSRWAARQLTPT